MLEEKDLVIKEEVSKRDKNKVFTIRQIPATKLRKLLFEYQEVFNCSTADNCMNITVNPDKKEELYFKMFNYIDCKTKVDGKTVINKLDENNIDAFIEDIDTMDFLIKEFWRLNMGEDMSPIQRSLDNLTNIL